MTSLYDEGWRQGTIFRADLQLDAVVLGSTGTPECSSTTHALWVVASQDCDLAGVDGGESQPCIELRPVHTESPPKDWGIRSSRFLLSETEYVISSTPRLCVAPNVLTSLLTGDVSHHNLEVHRSQAFTTWLGLRYDRPAVPDHLVPLAQHVSRVVRRHERSRAVQVRDVLMQFDDTTSPVRVSLFAVLIDQGDVDEIRQWLAGVAQQVEPTLGVVDQIEAATADGIAYSTIEQSYAADVTQVTWRPTSPNPEGAT